MKVLMIHVGNELATYDAAKPEFYLHRKSMLDGRLKTFLKHDIINADSQMQSLMAKGVDIEYGHFSDRRSFRSLIKAGRRIRRICKEERIELVHVLWGTTAALITIFFSPRPVVISFCGSDLLGTKNEFGHLTKGGKINRMFSKIAARFATQIITKSEHMRSLLPQKIQAKTTVIPNGVDLSGFYPMPLAESKEKLGWDTTKKHILFFYTEGQVVKNPKMALKVMELVNQEIPQAEMVIATKIPHEQLLHYYNASDVMILTSFHEGSNNSLKEAIACNLPVVSVNVGDAKERLGHLVACYVMDTFDPLLFKEKVVRVLNSGARSNGVNSSTEVSIEYMAEKVIAVYKKVLAK
ncbi:MAG: glycosyltransferase family 4 protein [Saprospiraceae bacterium]|nr:glycosyltransferase family 4 protein [Saprospiraceae bacterium]